MMRFFILFFGLVILSGCQYLEKKTDTLLFDEKTKTTRKNPSYETRILDIRPNSDGCDVRISTHCMLISEDGSDNWRVFYGVIKNFNYEKGYFYQIIVELEPREKHPGDSSEIGNYQYNLLKILKKTRIGFMDSVDETKAIDEPIQNINDPVRFIDEEPAVKSIPNFESPE